MNLSPLRSTLSRLSSPFSRQTDNSIAPYARRAQQKDLKGQKNFQPLQMVLDLLNRGQYLTANMADEVEESFRTGRPLGESTVQVLKAALEGIIGTRKGDWETLLFGGKIEGSSPQAGEREGWIPGTWGDEPLIKYGKEGSTGLAEGILRPRKLIGMAANIALDPTTYMGLGPTKAAKATAGEFAEDVVKLTLATMGKEDFAKLGIQFAETAGRNIDDIAKVITKTSIGKRFIEQTYNNAFKTAIRNASSELVQDVAPRLQVAATKDLPGLSDLITRIGKGYEKAGERAWRIGGKEFGASVRQPMAPVRAWDTLKTNLETTQVGSKLKDAWWSIMNRSPVGSLKKALGIRNPYEQLVHITKRRISDVGIHTMAQEEAAKFNQLFKGIDEETKDRALKIMISAEGGNASVTLRLMDPQFQAYHDIKPEEIDTFRGLFEKLKKTSDEWFVKEKEAASIAGLPFNAEPKIVYIPQKQGVGETAGGQLGRGGAQGTGASGFTKHKSMSVEQKIQNNAAVFDYLMHDKLYAAFEVSGKQDYAQWLNDWVMKNNLTESAIDLQTAFTLRGLDHAKAMARYDMIDEFRQFGIPIQDAIAADPRLEGSLSTWGEGVSQLGLYKVNVEGFQDYIFDEEVAKTLTNMKTMLAGDASTEEFAKAFGWLTQWWKGFVLMTPGYHIRNWISNNVTGFLKFGPRWMNEQKYFGPTVAGTMYAMHPENYMDLITKQLDVKPGWIQKQLNTPIGDFTVKEYADYARSSGLISSRTQIAGEIGQKFKGGTAEKLSAKQFKPFQVSQKLGDFNENTAKFKSFLMDMEDMVGKGTHEGFDLAERLATNKQYLKYADLESKKWFIDYGDLCFDKDTEILTDAGWQTVDSISYRHKALGFNLENGKMEWKPITYIHKAGYNGEMYRLTNQGFDAFVTPKHKWIKYGGDVGGHFTIKKPKWSLKETHYLFGDRKSVRIKVSDDSFAGVEPFFSDDFVELCGWVIAEGTYVLKGESIQVYQSESHNPRHCSRLRELAGRMSSLGTIKILDKRTPSRKDILVLYVGRGIAEHIRDWLPTKELTADFLVRLTRNQLELLYRTLINGDGTRNKKGSEIFTQKSKTTTDSMQMLGMMIGRRSVARFNNGIWKTGIYIKGSAAYSDAIKVDIEHYSGLIWCIHTDNKTVIARRNGTVYLSGNTDAEKKIFTKVIPFYSWLRHNISNQLSGLALYPEMYSIIPKVRGAITSDEDFDYSLMPDYMKNQGYYPVGQTSPGNFIMRWANIPLEDINKIPILFEEGNIFKPRLAPREVIDDIMAASHPLIKTMVEMATGYDVFHKREIRPFERASPIFQYLSNSPKVIEFLDGAMRLAGFEDGIKIKPSRDGKEVQINGKLERFLETNLPALRTLDLILGGGEVIAEQLDERIEGWIERTMGKKDYYTGLEELFQIISPMAGIKFREFNEDQERILKEARLYAEAQRLKQRDSIPSRAQETRNARARASRETRNRKLFR